MREDEKDRNEALCYYEEQQRKKSQPEAMIKTKVKPVPGKISTRAFG